MTSDLGHSVATRRWRRRLLIGALALLALLALIALGRGSTSDGPATTTVGDATATTAPTSTMTDRTAALPVLPSHTTPTTHPVTTIPPTATTVAPATNPTTTTTAARDQDGFAALDITVSTDRDAYDTGQPVTITIRSCNRTPATYRQRYTAPLYKTRIVDQDGETVADEQPKVAYPQVVTEQTWSPGECKENQIHWQRNTGPLRTDGSDAREAGPPAPAGDYIVVVDWYGYEGDTPSNPTISSPKFVLH